MPSADEITPALTPALIGRLLARILSCRPEDLRPSLRLGRLGLVPLDLAELELDLEDEGILTDAMEWRPEWTLAEYAAELESRRLE